jgi:hypothetical protein
VFSRPLCGFPNNSKTLLRALGQMSLRAPSLPLFLARPISERPEPMGRCATLRLKTLDPAQRRKFVLRPLCSTLTPSAANSHVAALSSIMLWRSLTQCRISKTTVNNRRMSLFSPPPNLMRHCGSKSALQRRPSRCTDRLAKHCCNFSQSFSRLLTFTLSRGNSACCVSTNIKSPSTSLSTTRFA